MPRLGRLPRWLCEELLASIPPAALKRIDEARATRAAFPHLTLRSLCDLSRYPANTFVRLPDGLIGEVDSNAAYDSLLLHIRAFYTLRPDSRLTVSPPAAGSSTVRRDHVVEVQVWRTAHLR